MARSESVSSTRGVPGCGTHACPASPQDPTTVLSNGSETKLSNAPPKPSFSVEFAGVTKSGWNLRSCKPYGGAFFVNQLLLKINAVSPVGGRILPSKSPANIEKWAAFRPEKQTAPAAPPAIIADRLKARTWLPTYVASPVVVLNVKPLSVK